MSAAADVPAKNTSDAAALDMAYSALLKRVLHILEGAGIPVMPLKGVLFAYWLYENPADRLGGDLDLLVPEQTFSKALAELRKDGFECKFDTLSGRECKLTVPNPAIEVDLHRALFARGRFQLPTADLFARGKEDCSLFTGKVVLPDPYDAYAHVIGHAAADHVPSLPARTQADLILLASRFRLEPGICAARLDAHGLSRATRYVYRIWGTPDTFGKEVLLSLRPDRWGDRISAFAVSVTQRFPAPSLRCRAAGFLLSASLFHAAGAMLLAVLNRVLTWIGVRPL